MEQDVLSLAAITREKCRDLGLVISGGGTHPFCSRFAKITPTPRFLAMERVEGYLGHTSTTYALHVHVGMTTGEETISVMRKLRPYLPVLLALSASSPFWWGHSTGYACYRQRVLAAMRSYGIPLLFESWKDFSDFFECANRAGAMCAGAASRLVGVISLASLQEAVRNELAPLGEDVAEKNVEKALEAFDLMAEHAGCVAEGEKISAETYKSPDWVDMPFEDARVSAPAIHAPATSVEVKTGLWRTMRPVVDYNRCNRCWWICSTFCPDSVISVDDEDYPQIDYGHCKGCMICVARCPRYVIEAIPEKTVRANKTGGEQP